MNLTSGYEVFDNSGKIDLQKSIEFIQFSLVERNSQKYQSFLKGLEKLKWLFSAVGVPFVKERVLLMKCIYYAMRLIDDICDGDTPNELGEKDKRGYIDIALTKPKSLGNGLLEELLKEISRLSGIIGFEKDIDEDISEIVVSMSFDLERVLAGGEIMGKEDLETNFHRMDIDGTIGATAIIFGLNPLKTKYILEELGDATRIGYTLEDLQSDINAGIINIPSEDMNEFGISRGELDNFAKNGIITNGLKLWIHFQVGKIDKLLLEYERKISQNNLELTFNGRFGKYLTTKLYNYLIKNKVLSTYVEETLKTREKILAVLT